MQLRWMAVIAGAIVWGCGEDPPRADRAAEVDVEEQTGIAIMFWAPPAFVYTDACRWQGSAIPVEPTVHFMADALVARAQRSSSEPRELAVGGHRVVEVELTVRSDLDRSTCDRYEGEPYFQSWASEDGATARYHQGPGQRDLVRLIDVDGTLLLVDAATWPELPDAERDEIDAVLDSVSFEVGHLKI